MTSNITLTAALRSNLLSLQGTQSLLDTVQLRLATGKKINSALDNPASFFAAQSLTNRATDLTRRLDGIGQAVQTLKSADEGIKTLTSFLEQAQAIAQEARDQATGGATKTGTVNLTAAQVADLTSGGFITNGEAFTVQLGSGATHQFTIATGESLQTLVDQINTVSGLTATVIPGSVANTSSLRIQSTNGQDIVVAEVGANNAGATILGSVGTSTATTGAPTDQVSLEASFNGLRSQIHTLVADASYRGTNLLSSDSLTVNFAETAGTSTLQISGVNFDVTSGSTNLTLAAANFSTIANIDTALTQITTALATVRAQASTFGNNLSILQSRQDFTQNLVNVLKEGSDKLTLADKNEEGANLLALQTSQQLGVSALSLASQSNQSVLRLFQ